MFEGKTILIGVSGGIASYKAAYLVSALSGTGANVEVIMTSNAARFISPLTFETLTGNRCYTDTFDRNFAFDVGHIALAKKADVFMIAPATANVIAKVANGIADDMLTTTFLAATKNKVIVPAMNTDMYLNRVTQDNVKKLRDYGIEVTEPAEGVLACGDAGPGRMPEPEELFALIERLIGREKTLAGKKVLVTAGATKELIDPVRFISNRSSGKMGFALAKEAMMRGADVTLVRAHTTAKPPRFVKITDVVSAADMFDAVTAVSSGQDIIIKAAAVADYTPVSYSNDKLKKGDECLVTELKRTKDILAYLGEHKPDGQVLCGFSMETGNMIENSSAKLIKKNADMIVANNLLEEGAGFGTDTNRVTVITRDGVFPQELRSKEDVAAVIFDVIAGMHEAKNGGAKRDAASGGSECLACITA